MTDREAAYERGKAILPGMAEASARRERRLWTLVTALALSSTFAWWHGSDKLAECKQERQQGFVVTLDKHGSRIDLPVADLETFRLADSMIADKLTTAVKCLRGLDASPRHVQVCWNETRQLFLGDDAIKSFLAYAKKYPTVDAILQAQQQGTIDVDVVDAIRPDPDNAPDRFLLRSTVRMTRNGKLVEEQWTDVFDVVLTPLDKSDPTSGLRIIRWTSKQDTAAKGAG